MKSDLNSGRSEFVSMGACVEYKGRKAIIIKMEPLVLLKDLDTGEKRLARVCDLVPATDHRIFLRSLPKNIKKLQEESGSSCR